MTKPRRFAHLVAARHKVMVRLWNEGAPLKAIALAVGLTNHSTIIHHLKERCCCAKYEAGIGQQEGK